VEEEVSRKGLGLKRLLLSFRTTADKMEILQEKGNSEACVETCVCTFYM
jgi:hypothetical protein